jgi:HSP20 family protein
MSNINRYDAFSDVFDDFFKGFLVRPVASSVGYDRGERTELGDVVRRARIDVTEQNGEYKVLAELPGVKKEDIKIEVDGDQVSISAESRAGRETKDGERLLHSERYYGRLARVFRVGQEVDPAKVSAKYENGILELTLPKKESTAVKQITVQ